MIGGTGSQVFRLNLEQGRFLNPLDLDSSSVQGVNAVDVNPAHQLWSFGVEGSGAGVKFWDPRSRNEIGSLDLPAEYLVEDNIANLGSGPLGVTSLASHSNGLSMAVGTSTGHTLLYDLRASKPFASKDQGYGLPIKNLQWLESASGRYDEADGKVASADSKVIKIWDKESTENYVNLTPESDINDMHIVPKTGLIMLANEAPEMSSYYVPQLGPAPKWCRFLDNITEELEGDMSGGVGPSAWSDYKFIDKSELESLQLNHLIGTAALKPYMHGFFISGELYSTAKLVSNPFAYAEHREKEIQAKLDKQAESRIRNSVKPNVKINKGLVDKLSKSSSKKSKKDDGKLLSDDRFKDMFENPEFEIDEDSKEFALRNPSGFNKGKTAVEQEEEESDKDSMDEDMSKGSSSEGEEEGDSGDESEGEYAIRLIDSTANSFQITLSVHHHLVNQQLLYKSLSRSLSQRLLQEQQRNRRAVQEMRSAIESRVRRRSSKPRNPKTAHRSEGLVAVVWRWCSRLRRPKQMTTSLNLRRLRVESNLDMDWRKALLSKTKVQMSKVDQDAATISGWLQTMRSEDRFIDCLIYLMHVL